MNRNDELFKDEIDQIASEYVLGTLSAGARADFAARMEADPRLRTLVAQWEERLVGLIEEDGFVEPPVTLWRNIEDRIDGLEPDGTTTLRAGAGRWKAIGPGVECKLLYSDKDSGARSLLMRLAPGATYPAHDHASLEECMIIEGDMIVGDLQLYAGDYHAVQAGTRHEEVTSQNGCLVFLRYAA